MGKRTNTDGAAHVPAVPDPVGPASSDAWADVMRGSIASMQATARWLLGVVAAWWFFVPQVTGLRQLVPAVVPWWATAAATAFALASAAATVWAVLRLQGGAGRPVEVRDLNADDLAYVQKSWGLMTEVKTSEEWRKLMAARFQVYEAARYLPHTPEADRHIVWRFGAVPTPETWPSHGLAIWAGDWLTMMRREERDAVLVLTYRDIRRRFDLMRWVVGVSAVVAAVGIVVLTGPPTP